MEAMIERRIVGLSKIQAQLNELMEKARPLKAGREKLLEEIENIKFMIKHNLRTTDDILGKAEYVLDGGHWIEGGPVLMYRNTWFIEVHEDHYELAIDGNISVSDCLRELEDILANYVVNNMGARYFLEKLI